MMFSCAAVYGWPRAVGFAAAYPRFFGAKGLRALEMGRRLSSGLASLNPRLMTDWQVADGFGWICNRDLSGAARLFGNSGRRVPASLANRGADD